MIRHELANIHMLFGESIHTYGTRTKILASKRCEPTAQCDLVAWFITRLPNEVEFYVRLQQPTTLDDAIKFALSWEVALLEISFS